MDLEAHWYIVKNLANITIRRIEKDVEHAEAFFTCNKTISVNVRDSQIHTQNAAIDSGVGFRVILSGKKMGFACVNDLTEKSMNEAVEKAISIARVSPEDPNLVFPEPSQLPAVRGLHDAGIDEMPVQDAVSLTKRAIESTQEQQKGLTIKMGEVLFISGWRGITNTLGVDFEERETSNIVTISGSGKDEHGLTDLSFDFYSSRKADFNPENFGASLGKKIAMTYNPQPIESFEGPVVFSPIAVALVILPPVIYSILGDAVLSKKSVWAGKVGDIVTSPFLTIQDDPFFEGGYGSRRFDDEGSASNQTMIIQKGELKEYLQHARSSKTLNVSNTSNASRFSEKFDMLRFMIGNGYRTPPEIYPSNLIINPSSKTQEHLISEIEKGVFVDYMGGRAQPETGQISAALSPAFLIENGVIKHAIKGNMIAGSIYEWLEQLSGISQDSRMLFNSVIPSLRVENVKIIGSS